MRIVKHTQECVNAGTYSIGFILGLDIDGRLEVTESVPLPPKHEQEEGATDDSNKVAEDRHQRETLENLVQVVRCLQSFSTTAILTPFCASSSLQTNFDNYHVGLYHSTYMGYFYADALVDILLDFQKREELSKNTVALMYDPFQTSKGDLYIRAFRLSPRYLQMREAGGNAFMPAEEILESLPVKITCNSVATGFVRCLADTPSSTLSDGFLRRGQPGGADGERADGDGDQKNDEGGDHHPRAAAAVADDRYSHDGAHQFAAGHSGRSRFG